MTKIISINPSNKQILGEVESSTPQEVKLKVEKAKNALKEWKELGIVGRVKQLRKVADGFTKRQKSFAELTSKEMGMPISQSIHDVSGAIDYFNWYLNNAEKYLSPEIVYEDDKMIHKVIYEPYGVVAAIAPW